MKQATGATGPTPTDRDRSHPPHLRQPLRALAILALCAGAFALLSLDAVQSALANALAAIAPVIAAHPVAGVALFVVLAALSALVAFFSSAVLVPVALHTWGPTVSALLLWLGWWLGGLCAYGLGRALRRPLLRRGAVVEAFAFYRARLPSDPGFFAVLLLQLALPSEIPGYLCGMMRVPLRTYILALALAELPYAAGTVLIGDSLLRQRLGLLATLAALGAAASWYAVRRLRRHLAAHAPAT